MWDDAATTLERELSDDERLLWSGQPRGGIRLRAYDAFMIPFSLFWCGFAIFWEAMALGAIGRNFAPQTIMFPLFGVPFVLIGLYMLFGRFFVEAQMRAKTFYGVTDDRIIIVSGLFSRRTKSLNLRTLTDVSLSERSDGSGTITFGPQFPFGQWAPAGSWPGASQFMPPAFDMIEDAKSVYDVIRKAQKAAA
jgi:hypothetical protein